MSKIITLVAAGYTNCVAGDIGKQVQDDTVEIGVLLGYNNTVFIHVEAPDEAGHAGDVERKIEAIENIDSRLIGKIFDG